MAVSLFELHTPHDVLPGLGLGEFSLVLGVQAKVPREKTISFKVRCSMTGLRGEFQFVKDSSLLVKDTETLSIHEPSFR